MPVYEYDKQMGKTFNKYKGTKKPVSIQVPYDIKPKKTKAYYTKISVVNADTLDTSMKLKNPVVLNLANGIKPCWGQILSHSQEEEIFRRSNLFLGLQDDFYPLKETLIYTKNVEIYLDSEYKECTPWNVDIITCAAIDCPFLVKGALSKKDHDLTYKKIEAILVTAINNGHDNIVLGALGCGVFQNPPREIALIFKDLLTKYSFKEVIFAILSKEEDDKNFSIFKEVLLEI